MKKSITSYILMLCLLLTVLPIGSLAADGADPLLMYDSFEYAIASNWTALGTLGDGGSGWASRWAGDKSDFTSACPATPRVTLTPAGTSEKVQIKNSATIYRKFGSALSASEDGEYYVDSNVYAGFQNATYTTLLWSMGIGDSISCGFEDKGDGSGILPYLKSGAATVYGTDTLTAAATYKLTLRISVNDDGSDKVYMRLTEDGAPESTGWLLAADVDISEDLSYISYGVPNSTSYLYVQDVAIYGYDAAPVRAFEAFAAKAENVGITEEDLVEAMTQISSLPDCTLRSKYASYISSKAEESGITDIMDDKLTESSPADGAHVYAEDIEQITLSYRYKLSPQVSGAVLSDGTDSAEAQVSVSGNDIIVTPQSTVSYNKSYTLTIEGLTDFKGDPVSDNQISFTTSIVPAIDITDGGEYGEGKRINWLIYDGITTTAEITIDGSEPIDFENGTALMEQGDYVLTLSSRETEGEQKTEERVYSFTVLPAYEPSVSNLSIEGTMATGETVTAVYDFTDRNTEPEGVSLYQWYSCDTEDGTFTPIEGANGKTYTLTEADEDKYLMVEVTPVAVSELNSTGEPKRCEPVAAAFRPTASDIKISGEIVLGKELKASFVYSDINGNDYEGTHDYTWYTKSSSGEEAEVGTGDTYTVAETDYEKQIFVRIVPKSTLKPYDGKATDSEAIYAPAMPVAKDVRIEGTAKSGNTISGYYTYYDVNGDEQANTTGKWVNASTGAVLGEGNSLKLTSSMEGMSIAYVVTPASVNEPKVGESVRSSAVTVGKDSSGGGGGYSYSGSTSGSAGGGSSVKVPTQPVTKPSVPVAPVNPDSFGDMAGHWAESYVTDLKKAGLVSGVSDTEFAPSRNVSRAEFVVMMVRLGAFTSEGYQGGFDDVSAEDWFSEALQAAVDAGIISPDVSFRPQAELTRAEAAKIVSVIMTKLSYTGDETDTEFTDASELPEWAAEYIDHTASQGIMVGDDKGSFRPYASITRAEAATIMWRLYQGGISK